MSQTTTTWIWWSAMLILSIFNVSIFLGICIHSRYRPSTETLHTKAYQAKMRWLAFPFVLECAWRSIFPSVYNSRQTFFDTPLNSIMLDRTLAAIGEVTWMCQVALALAFVNRQLGLGVGVVLVLPVSIVFLSVAGETCSYLGVATTNCLFEVLEESCWTLIYILMMLAGIHLALNCMNRSWACAYSAKFFARVLIIQGFIMLPYQLLSYLPMYYQRWRQDENAHVRYLQILHGLSDATIRREPTKDWQKWQSEWLWMTAYFSLAVWTSLLLMAAPRIQGRLEGVRDLEKETPASIDEGMNTPLSRQPEAQS